MSVDRLDAARDAAALLRTVQQGDREGREVILDHGDTREIAEALAAALHGTLLATYSGCRACAAEFITTWQQTLLPEVQEPVRGTSMTSARDLDAIEAARRPKSCRRCGRTFGNGTAYAVHFESGEGSACLPGDAYGQLVQVDGVWCTPGKSLSATVITDLSVITSQDHVLSPERVLSVPENDPRPLSGQLRAVAHRSERIGREALRQMASSADHLEARAAQADELEARASLQVTEPGTYQRGGPHSFFADLAKVATGRGDRNAAKLRLERHEDEVAVFYPAWRESRRQAAQRAYEQEFASTRRGEILLERMEKFGLAPFRSDRALEANYERRAINRTASSAGYFVPPLWALEDWAMAPRAGRAFADLWTSMPLPPGTDQINVPHWTTGLATGPQADGAAVVGDSPADSFATSNVVTISGYQDVSMQWAEQTAPPGADAFVFGDLMDDAAGNLDAQLWIGSGSGQLNGIIVGGSASASNLVVIANSQNVSGSTITVASGSTPVYTSVSRMLKVMGKARGKRATHIVLNDATWWDLVGAIATTGAPIVPVSASAPEPGPDGALGTAWGLPVIGDNQLPLTFGGTTAPSLAASGAVTAATAGSGSYAVIAAVRAPDLYLFEGELRVRVMQEVASGTGQWRYQVHQYAAALRDRYTAGSTISISTGTDTGGVNSGGTPSAGVVTNYQTNSPLASE